MQLNAHKPARLAATLGLVTAALLSANSVRAQDQSDPGLMKEGVAEPGSITVDSAVLFYQERGGRVRAIEPSTQFVVNRLNGDTISASFTYDSLTGATPNGAAPSSEPQTFTSLVPSSGSQSTTTSASGNRTVVNIPGTSFVQSRYTVPANTLPLDRGFRDHRYAASLGYSMLVDPDTRIKLGGAFSSERDYSSYSGNIGISHDLFSKNTTLSLAANLEYDRSKPFLGTPAPFQNYSTQITGGSDSKTVVSVVAGITQTLTRFWLTQLNYSYGSGQGYQSDPYKILSLVSQYSGYPVSYVYESRPRSRVRQSIYWGNKIAMGPTVADLSLRYYHDNWGIDSITAEASEQVPVTRNFYVQPLFRYYHQSAANFFHYYLPFQSSLPQYASADGRLSRFDATTIGVKAGLRVLPGTELYVDAEDYRQTGRHYDRSAPGDLASLNLFSGVHAFSVMTGFKFKLR